MCDSPIPDAFPGRAPKAPPATPGRRPVRFRTASFFGLSCRLFDPSALEDSIAHRQPAPTHSVLNLELSTLNLRPLSLFLATLTSRPQLIENSATLSPLFATLTRSFAPKSFACHSYTKTPGVGALSSLRNLCSLCASAASCLLAPFGRAAHQERPKVKSSQLLSFHLVPHSFALLQKLCLLFSRGSKLFLQNTRGWGPDRSEDHSKRSEDLCASERFLARRIRFFFLLTDHATRHPVQTQLSTPPHRARNAGRQATGHGSRNTDHVFNAAAALQLFFHLGVLRSGSYI
jgi:hypothetical protein